MSLTGQNKSSSILTNDDPNSTCPATLNKNETNKKKQTSPFKPLHCTQKPFRGF